MGAYYSEVATMPYVDTKTYSPVSSTVNTSLNVYVIDKDPKDRGVLKRMLEDAGHSVVEFDTAERFLSLIDREPFGCIFAELHLAEMDALELLKEVRSKGWKTPVIIVTAHNEISACAGAFAAGATDYLEKPVTPERFAGSLEAVSKLCSQRHEELAAQKEAESKLSTLTSREREVLELLVEGQSMKTIASNSGTSFQAVARHRQRILEKLGLEGDVALARWVFDLRRGI